VFRLSCALHGHVQALLDQLVVEEGHSQTTQAAGRLSSIVTVSVLSKQLRQGQNGEGGGSREWV
jgi:hypothetical protein